MTTGNGHNPQGGTLEEVLPGEAGLLQNASPDYVKAVDDISVRSIRLAKR
jgi:hypothetical protein